MRATRSRLAPGWSTRLCAFAMAREAPDRIRDLLAYGVPFDKDLEGRLTVGREAAHSARRIVHVRGDQAGRRHHGGARRSSAQDAEHPRASKAMSPKTCITRGRAVTRRSGARCLTGGSPLMPARAVVLATGGVGHLYAVTTNPSEARGHGLAIAARAGAVIADPEFVQFHPTAIDIGRDPAPLATEAIRGEGAWLVNKAGERFMLAIHPEAELAPRDIVARGVFAEIAGRTRRVSRCTHGDRRELRAALPRRHRILPQRRHRSGARSDPGRARRALSHGRRVRPTSAAAHRSIGLWAAGEVASTGAHGANRLASNSLLEAVVYAARIAEDIVGLPPAPRLAVRASGPQGAQQPVADPARERTLRELMSAHVGVIRDRDGLKRALSEIARIERDSAHLPQTAQHGDCRAAGRRPRP